MKIPDNFTITITENAGTLFYGRLLKYLNLPGSIKSRYPERIFFGYSNSIYGTARSEDNEFTLKIHQFERWSQKGVVVLFTRIKKDK